MAQGGQRLPSYFNIDRDIPEIEADLRRNSDGILRVLGFYEEYGEPEGWDDDDRADAFF